MDDQKIALLFDRLKTCTEEIKVLGSYPAFNQATPDSTTTSPEAPARISQNGPEGPQLAPLKSQTVALSGSG